MTVHLDGARDRAGKEGETYSGLLRWLGCIGCLLMNHLRLWGGTSKSRVFWDRLGQTSEISFLNSASHWCCLTPPAERERRERGAWRRVKIPVLSAHTAIYTASTEGISLTPISWQYQASTSCSSFRKWSRWPPPWQEWTQQDHHCFNPLTLCCYCLNLSSDLLYPSAHLGCWIVSRKQQHVLSAMQRTRSEVLDYEQCHDWL